MSDKHFKIKFNIVSHYHIFHSKLLANAEKMVSKAFRLLAEVQSSVLCLASGRVCAAWKIIRFLKRGSRIEQLFL
jgi:hypothetical protein